MARRPASAANLPDIPLTLEMIFNRQELDDAAPNPEAAGQPETGLGRRLRDLRQARGLSIRALSKHSGLAINTLSMIENGRNSPSVSTLQVLARALPRLFRHRGGGRTCCCPGHLQPRPERGSEVLTQ